MSGSSLFAILLIIGTLLSGTISGIANKVLYSVKADGDCDSHKFNKPFFLTLAMFVGESISLLVYFVSKRYSKSRSRSSEQIFQNQSPQTLDDALINHNFPMSASINGKPGSDSPSSLSDPGVSARPPLYYFAILSLFDLTATCLSLVGLNFVDLSVYSMLRGSMVVFTVIFSAIILKAKYNPKQWAWIVVVIAGLTVVGTTGVLRTNYPASDTPPPDSSDSAPSASSQALGIFLVTLGSAFNAAQNVVEELLMKKYDEGPNPVHPLEVVGYEGIFGVLFSSFLVLPILSAIPGSDCGDKQENTIDTLKMMSNGAIVGLTLAYLLCLAFMNWSSVAISKVLTAVHRQLVSACRTILIWIIDILIYYEFSKTYGEFWDFWSFLQLGGFFLLLAGTFGYSFSGSKSRGGANTAVDDIGDLEAEDRHALNEHDNRDMYHANLLNNDQES